MDLAFWLCLCFLHRSSYSNQQVLVMPVKSGGVHSVVSSIASECQSMLLYCMLQSSGASNVQVKH